MNRLLLAVAVFPAVVCGGCIVEKTGSTGPQGVPIKPLAGGEAALAATPAGLATSSRTIVAAKPLGEVMYDGLTLPLVSPDGRYLVTQVDEPPSWPLILAEPTRTPPIVRARQRVYDLASGSPVFVEPVERLTGGMLLGRSATTEGYLVEAPQSDGSRWIGRVGWTSGKVDWIVQGQRCAAFAIDGPDGAIMFCEREVKGAAFELVVKRPGRENQRLALAGETLMFPLLSAAGGHGAVIALDTRGRMELATFSLVQSEGDTVSVLVRHRLAETAASPSWAFQACSPLLASAWSNAANAPAAFAVIAPRTGRPVLLDAMQTQGLDLPGPSVSVCVIAGDDAGVLLTRPESIEKIAANAIGGTVSRTGGARLLSKPYLVRGKVSDREVVLVGPVRTASEPKLEIVRLLMSQPGSAAPASPSKSENP